MSEESVKLILHGDDAGLCHSTNAAVSAAMEKGLLRSASIMMPCPWAREMVDIALAHPEWDIGLHLTLTSEWEVYRWRPVSGITEVPSLVDDDGFLWRDEELVATHAEPDEVEREVRAQLEMARRWGLQPTHLDNHMGSLFVRPEFVEIFYKLAVESSIPPLLADLTPEEIKAINPALDVGSLEALDVLKEVFPVLKSFASIEEGSLQGKMEQALNKFESFKPGLHEIILHPAQLTEELQAITASAEDRDRDFRLLLSTNLSEEIMKRGIQITNWIEAAHEKR